MQMPKFIKCHISDKCNVYINTLEITEIIQFIDCTRVNLRNGNYHFVTESSDEIYEKILDKFN